MLQLTIPINIQNSLAFVYTNTNQKKKIKKIPLIIASKRIKYLAANLIKDIKDQ